MFLKMKRVTPILFVLVLLLALTSCDDGVQYCTVTFKAEDGSTYLTQTVVKNAKVSSVEGPKKDGTWSFDCWLNEKTGAKFDFNEAVQKDVSLIASYVKGYKVTFDSNGRTAVSAQFIEDGKTVIEPKDPTKGEITFKYWAKVKTDGSIESGAYDFSQPVTSSFTLKAVYNNMYTVTYKNNVDFNEVKSSEQVLEGTKLTKPDDPSYSSGYDFIMWTSYNKVTTDVEYYDFTKPVTSDLSLFAVFEKTPDDQTTLTYTVKFVDSDGTTLSSQSGIERLKKVIEPVSPTKDGYIFKHWLKEVTKDGQQYSYEYNFNEPVTSDFTLKAVYENVYTVTFDSMGGDYTPEEQKIANGGVASEPKSPDKESTRGFMWWATSIDTYGNSTPYDFSTPVTSNLTLYAVYWPANLRAGDYSVYDTSMYAKYNEIEYQHNIIKKLVNVDALMNGGTNVKTVFNISNPNSNSLVLSIFTNAKMTPDEVNFSDGTSVDTSDSHLTYHINLDDCSIESNSTTKVYKEFTESTKYTINITKLKLNISFVYYDGEYHSDTQEVEISLKGTFLRNSDDRYEFHTQMTIGNKAYPVLHASAITSPVSAGRSDYDNVLCFSYGGFSSYITIDSLW